MNKKDAPLIYIHQPTQPNRSIRLTAQDRRVKPMTGLKSVINATNKVTNPMPSQEEAPELYYVCPRCGVIPPQWLLKKWYRRSCPCEQEARQLREQAEKVEAWLSWQRINCYGGWLGPDHKDMAVINAMIGKSFEGFQTGDDDTTYRAARQYAMTDKPKGNKIFIGAYGTGKTHLGAAILNYRRERYHDVCLFASAPQLFGAYEEARRSLDQTQFISIRQRMIQAKFLYLDDIDKEWRGDWKQTELHSIYYYIFDERYKARRSTIVSTNDMDSLDKYIGSAARSRLMSLCEILPMFGEDFRAMEEW